MPISFNLLYCVSSLGNTIEKSYQLQFSALENLYQKGYVQVRTLSSPSLNVALICVFLRARLLIWYHDLDSLTFEFSFLFQNFNLGHDLLLPWPWPSDLWHWSLAFFLKTNLGYNFWLVGARAFIFHTCITSGKTFHLIPWPWPTDLWPFRKTHAKHILWMLCFIEIFDETKETMPILKPWRGPLWLGQCCSLYRIYKIDHCFLF
jgi:hypothetical protein